MLDFSHLPQNATISEFIGPSGIQAWQKPPNATLVFMMCIGGGGGGGRGHNVSSGGGGGGGGSGGLTQALFLASVLPSSLIVAFDGSTGDSGNAGATVSIGNYASASASPQTDYIQANGALSGLDGSLSAGGSGGLAADIATPASNCSLINTAIYFVARAGRSGGSGSTVGATSQTIGTQIPILGGAGGGGSSNTGGGFVGPSLLVPSIDGGNPGGGPAGNGLFINRPFLSVGGMGGGGASSLPGGTGGTAPGYGAGGGGGGAGTTTTSAGGRGGQAYACIIAW